MYLATLMLLGSGELGREFAIAAKRLGCRVIACDRYAHAPAMQCSDASEVFSMLDGGALRAAVEKHRPDVIVPEIEAIDTATLAELEREGWRVAPSAKAVQLTMNRDGIREFAARELGLVTSRYQFAESRDEALAAANFVGLPCVIKPVMSSSGKGQSTARSVEEVGAAWDYAVAKMRGDRPRAIVEEFIAFDSEITLLTVATNRGILFCEPVGHHQEAGDGSQSRGIWTRSRVSYSLSCVPDDPHRLHRRRRPHSPQPPRPSDRAPSLRALVPEPKIPFCKKARMVDRNRARDD
jgi:phosphoribosylglycinamide formyltransferase 2